MKLGLLASALLVIPISSAWARGDGFGSAFGGSIVGSTLGTIIGNSVSRPPPPPPPVYYQPAPVYIAPRPYYVPPPAPVRHVPVYAAALPPDPQSVSYQQGLADRDSWDSWYGKLDGSMKQGAQFWADNRGRPNAQQCRVHASYGNDWLDGCTSAQRRLAAPDERRRTDAQYRNGWDKLLPEVRSASVTPPPPPVTPVVPASVPAPVPTPPDVRETGLGDVFTADMLNVEVPYFEKTVGPAKRVFRIADDRTVRTYAVGGCPVKAHVQGTSIYAYSMDLSNGCTINLKPFFDDLASTKNLTLGKFVRFEGEGQFHAGCLVDCGKNDDTDASYHWQGPRSMNKLEVVLVFPLHGNGAPEDAADRLAKTLSDKDGAAYVTSAAFNCDTKENAAALDAYKDVAVQEIIIGYGIEDETGAYKAACRKTN